MRSDAIAVPKDWHCYVLPHYDETSHLWQAREKSKKKKRPYSVTRSVSNMVITLHMRVGKAAPAAMVIFPGIIQSFRPLSLYAAGSPCRGVGTPGGRNGREARRIHTVDFLGYGAHTGAQTSLRRIFVT